MKVITITTVLSILTFTSAEVVLRNGRRYVPAEEKVTQEEYMYIVDDNGVMHWENLKLDTKAVEVNVSDVRLYLYTNENSNGEMLRLDSLDDLLNSPYYKPSRKHIFTAHGWRSFHTSAINSRTREAILNNGEEINAFAIDWHTPSDQFYTLAVWSIPLVGKIIGNYINQMITEYDLDASNFIFIGHSLGAHVLGCIGANVNGEIDQIIGLDPAWPMFSLEDRDIRLDETDARIVHIGHTSAGFQGFTSSIGHADYFFNGGTKQPGCGPDISNGCSHGRATDYYVESISTSEFRATQCSSYEEFQSGACIGNREVSFGAFPVDDTIFGDYYLDTAESSPFALG